MIRDQSGVLIVIKKDGVNMDVVKRDAKNAKVPSIVHMVLFTIFVRSARVRGDVHMVN
jgi:hypothetical protein